MGYDFRIDLLWPETALLALAVLVCFADMLLRPERRGTLLGLAAAGLAVIIAGMVAQGAPAEREFALHGQWVVDGFSHTVKIFLLGVLLSVILVSRPWVAALGPLLGEHLLLVLLSGLGMIALASANDLIVLFVALELATIPLMVLTALWRRDPVANEAAVKFLIAGSVASAFTIFGLGLVWGFSGGTTSLTGLHAVIQGGAVSGALTVGLILLFAGLAFKTAIAPFHVWVPDVYEGAPTPITAFLAGGSKAAGFTALLRVGSAAFVPAEAAAPPVFDWPVALAFLAGLTAVLGNMGAMWQANLKRLLAHASVGHAGFLLMGLAVLGTAGAELGLTALAFYLAFYAVAVASVFFVMGLVSRAGGGETLRDYEGLARRSPALAAALLVGVLSMGGIPPMAGFAGKIFIVAATWKGGLHVLAFVAGFAMVLSIVYTLMILRAVFVAPAREGLPAVRVAGFDGAALLVLSLALIVFGVYPQPVTALLTDAVQSLLAPGAAPVLVALGN